ncbi:MAG: cellulase family glycosylhydrolase [Planctomycetota bacterium]
MSTAQRWTVEQSQAWRQQVGWLMGANYLPRSAQNQLAMWQAETFDLAMIREEFGWAAEAGLNAFRIYLHDLLAGDLPGFLDRMQQVSDLAAELGHKLIYVFFDDCWRPDPQLGPQLPPVPRMHNSRWVQSPGSAVRGALDASQLQRLGDYVSAVIERFDGHDAVVLWDLYNEPGNPGESTDAPASDFEGSLALLESAFEWARAVGPSKPLTAGHWHYGEAFQSLNAAQARLSDVASFHFYSHPHKLERALGQVSSFYSDGEVGGEQGRAMVCTEYMARVNHNLFFNVTPLLKERGIDAIHWGLVAGASNTKYPWGSQPSSPEPLCWHHELLHPDGSAYDEAELAFLRGLSPRG